MATSRTKAILRVLARGGDDDVAQAVLRVFGATSIDECLVTYDAVGAAERASIDEGVARAAAKGGAAFALRVDAEDS